MENMEDRFELIRMERDYNNKLATYNMYISQGKEPPRELVGSLESLERSIESKRGLIRSMEFLDSSSNKNRHTR